mmetsp:Transcript_30157/g.50088  ORF Transcript_30157/g.50088 Transcript_30157/m.50088 type:complete len:95 (+) Transcript_30157:397-681(+)
MPPTSTKSPPPAGGTTPVTKSIATKGDAKLKGDTLLFDTYQLIQDLRTQLDVIIDVSDILYQRRLHWAICQLPNNSFEIYVWNFYPRHACYTKE